MVDNVNLAALAKLLGTKQTQTLGATGQSPVDMRLANALATRAMRTTPVSTPFQALARLGEAAIAGYQRGTLEEEQQKRMAARQTALNQLGQSVSQLEGLNPGQRKMLKTLSGVDPSAAMKFLGGHLERKQEFQIKKKEREQEFQIKKKEREQDFKIQKEKFKRKMPASRIRIQGGRSIFEQINPRTGKLEIISEGPRWQTQKEQKSAAQKNLESMNLIPGTPEYNKVMAAQMSGSNVSIVSDGKGGLKITYGKGAGKGLGKATENLLNKKVINATEALARIRGIGRKFDADFLTVGNKAKAWFTGMKTRIYGLGSVSTEDAEFHRRYTAFMSKSRRHVVLLLNELSGAAITPEEAKRILSTVPDPGGMGFTEILSGDDPSAFMAKLEEVQISLTESLMRLHYYRKEGLIGPTSNIPTDDLGLKVNKNFMDLMSFGSFLDRKVDEINKNLIDKGLTGEELASERNKYLVGMFGPAAALES